MAHSMRMFPRSLPYCMERHHHAIQVQLFYLGGGPVGCASWHGLLARAIRKQTHVFKFQMPSANHPCQHPMDKEHWHPSHDHIFISNWFPGCNVCSICRWRTGTFSHFIYQIPVVISFEITTSSHIGKLCYSFGARAPR